MIARNQSSFRFHDIPGCTAAHSVSVIALLKTCGIIVCC